MSGTLPVVRYNQKALSEIRKVLRSYRPLKETRKALKARLESIPLLPSGRFGDRVQGGPISSPVETAAEIRLEIEARLDKVTFKLDDINDFSDVLRETDEELFQVFLLKYEQGRSDEDIAAELGYSRATVERRGKAIIERAALFWGKFD